MADAFKKLIDSVRDIRTDAVTITDLMIAEIGKVGRAERWLGWLTFAGSLATVGSSFVAKTSAPWLPVAAAIGTAVVAGLTKLQARDRDQKLPRLLAAAKSAGTVEVEAGSHIDMWSNEASEGKFDLKTGIASRNTIKTRLNDLKSEVAQLDCEPQYVKRDKTGTRSRITHGASSSRFVYYEDAPYRTETASDPAPPSAAKQEISIRRVD